MKEVSPHSTQHVSKGESWNVYISFTLTLGRVASSQYREEPCFEEPCFSQIFINLQLQLAESNQPVYINSDIIITVVTSHTLLLLFVYSESCYPINSQCKEPNHLILWAHCVWRWWWIILIYEHRLVHWLLFLSLSLSLCHSWFSNTHKSFNTSYCVIEGHTCYRTHTVVHTHSATSGSGRCTWCASH